MKNLSIFLAFFCILFGCKKQIKPQKTDQIDPIVNEPCSVSSRSVSSRSVSAALDNSILECYRGSSKPSSGSIPQCLWEHSPILKPKYFNLLCRDIKKFNIKQEPIGNNDSVVINVDAYKAAFLAGVQEARREQYFITLQELLYMYQRYDASINNNKFFCIYSCLGIFEYIIQNQKIISASDDCLIGEKILEISYRYKKPYLRIDFNLLQGETYKITGGGIVWVNGKINASKYTKNGEQLFKFSKN
jgi:hypothetical protein